MVLTSLVPETLHPIKGKAWEQGYRYWRECHLAWWLANTWINGWIPGETTLWTVYVLYSVLHVVIHAITCTKYWYPKLAPTSMIFIMQVKLDTCKQAGQLCQIQFPWLWRVLVSTLCTTKTLKNTELNGCSWRVSLQQTSKWLLSIRCDMPEVVQ